MVVLDFGTATGQFQPGALSKADPRTQFTSVGSQRIVQFIPPDVKPVIGLSNKFTVAAERAGVPTVQIRGSNPINIVDPGFSAALVPGPSKAPGEPRNETQATLASRGGTANRPGLDLLRVAAAAGILLFISRKR